LAALSTADIVARLVLVVIFNGVVPSFVERGTDKTIIAATGTGLDALSPNFAVGLFGT